MVVSRLEEDALQRIAQDTGGAYVRSVGGASDTRGLAADMRRTLTKQATEVHRERVWDERFQWPLAGGLGLLFIAGLLGDGRRKGLGVVALLLLAPLPAQAQELETALQLLQDERPAEAVGELELLREQDPSNPQVLTALAEALAQSGQHQRAAEAYEELARRSSDEELQTRALYNAGHQRYQQGELEDAVQDWQQVLERQPEHEAAKHNAEQVQNEIQRRMAQPSPQPQQQPEQQPGASGQTEEHDGTRSERPEGGEPGQLDPELEAQEAQPGEGGSEASSYGAEEMSEEEARKLLNGVEEGDPRVVVRGQSRSKDW